MANINELYNFIDELNTNSNEEAEDYISSVNAFIRAYEENPAIANDYINENGEWELGKIAGFEEEVPDGVYEEETFYGDDALREMYSTPETVPLREMSVDGVSPVINVYEPEINYGIFKFKQGDREETFGCDNGQFFHLKGDTLIDESNKESVLKGVNHIDEQYERKIFSEKDVNAEMVKPEGHSNGIIRGGKVQISYSLISDNNKGIDPRDIKETVSTNFKHNDNGIFKNAVLRETGIAAEKREALPTNEKGRPDKIPGDVAIDKAKVFAELRTEMLSKNLETIEKYAEIKDFTDAARSTGFLTQDDEKFAAKKCGGDSIVRDVINVSSAILRIKSIPIVIDLATKRLAAQDSPKLKEILDRSDNINKEISKLEPTTPFSEIKELIGKLSLISAYIKDDIAKIDIHGVESNGISKNEKIVTEEGMVNDNIKKTLHNIKDQTIHYSIKDGQISPIDLDRDVKDSAKVVAEAKEKAIEGKEEQQVDKTIEENRNKYTTFETHSSNMDSDADKTEEESFTKEDETKTEEQKTDRESTREQKADQNKETKTTNERRSFNDYEDYDPNTGTTTGGGRRGRTTKTDVVLGAVVPGVLAIALLPIMPPLALGFAVLAVVGTVSNHAHYKLENKTTKDEPERETVKQEEPKVENKVEKEPKTPFMDRVADKIHDFGEKIRESREGVYQKVADDKVVKGDFASGIDYRGLKSSVGGDMVKDSHPNIDKISKGLHGLTKGGVIGKIFDKIMTPFTRTTSDVTRTYVDTAGIRAKDIARADVGLKGDTVASAFSKVVALAKGVGTPAYRVIINVGENNIDKSTIDRNREIYREKGDNTTFTVKDFFKSAGNIIKSISLGTMIASARTDLHISKPDIDAQKIVKETIQTKDFDTAFDKQKVDAGIELAKQAPASDKRDEYLKEGYKSKIDIIDKQIDKGGSTKELEKEKIETLKSKADITKSQIEKLENKEDKTEQDKQALKDLYNERKEEIDEQQKNDDSKDLEKEKNDIDKKLEEFDKSEEKVVDEAADEENPNDEVEEKKETDGEVTDGNSKENKERVIYMGGAAASEAEEPLSVEKKDGSGESVEEREDADKDNSSEKPVTDIDDKETRDDTLTNTNDKDVNKGVGNETLNEQVAGGESSDEKKEPVGESIEKGETNTEPEQVEKEQKAGEEGTGAVPDERVELPEEEKEQNTQETDEPLTADEIGDKFASLDKEYEETRVEVAESFSPKSDDIKTDILEYADNELSQIPDSDRQDIIEKIMDKYDLPEDDRQEIRGKFEQPDNGNEIEQIANEIAADNQSTIGHMADFVSDVWDKVKDFASSGVDFVKDLFSMDYAEDKISAEEDRTAEGIEQNIDDLAAKVTGEAETPQDLEYAEMPQDVAKEPDQNPSTVIDFSQNQTDQYNPDDYTNPVTTEEKVVTDDTDNEGSVAPEINPKDFGDG